MMTQNTAGDALNLLAECVIFAKKWLCWRKWLRVTGILEWSMHELQVKTDTGQVVPIYHYEESREKYFAALTAQKQLNLIHFSSGHQQKNLTGEALRQLMIRGKRMQAIEREWCRINGQAIFRHPLFSSLLTPPINEPSGDGEIDSATMVTFYRRLCYRLAALTGIDSLHSEAHHHLPSATWRIDSTLRTFDDETILLMIEMLARCTIDKPHYRHGMLNLPASGDDNPPPDYQGKDKLWLTVPIKRRHGSSFTSTQVTLNVNDRNALTAQDKAGVGAESPPGDQQTGHADSRLSVPVTLKLSSIRSMLNQHIMPQNILYFQPDRQVEQTITYAKILMDLIDNHPLIASDHTELNEVVSIVQLKNIARFLLCYSKWRAASETPLTHNEEKQRFFFFPNNGIAWYSPITEALLLLFDDREEAGMTITTNINDGEIHDRVMVPADMPMHEAILRYRQRRQGIKPDRRRQTQLFSLWVTSLLFHADGIYLAGKRLTKNTTSVHLNTQKGFYLRHEKYRHIMMVFLPSTQAPHYERLWQCDDNMAVLLGQGDNDLPPSPETNRFLRLVLLRAEDCHHPSSPSDPSPPVNLDDPRILCEFLKDITNYFDPRRERYARLFRVDPFLSHYIDTASTRDCQLDPVPIDNSHNKAGKQQKHLYFNIKLWQILRDLPPPKSLLVRSSPLCYGPELYGEGITQRHKGMVPLEINTSRDTWKLYAYDDNSTTALLNNNQLVAKTYRVASRDRTDNNWIMTQNAKMASRANLLSPPVIVRLINWYDDHYPTGKPTIKKIIAKRIYLINDVIAFCEDPTKLVCGEKFNIEKVQKIYDRNFANYHLWQAYHGEKNYLAPVQDTIDTVNQSINDLKQSGLPVSRKQANNDALLKTHFSQMIYQAMRDNNINYHTKHKTVSLRFDERPAFFVMYFQCTSFWFPKWQGGAPLCYDGVPQHMVPLMQWSLDKAIITKA